MRTQAHYMTAVTIFPQGTPDDRRKLQRLPPARSSLSKARRYTNRNRPFRAVEPAMQQEKLTLDTFIESRIGQQVDVFVVNGVKLAAVTVVGHDKDAIFLRNANDPSTILATLWSAISSVASHDSEPSQTKGRRK